MSTKITLDDLLASESAVLNRIGQEMDEELGLVNAAHSSHTSGHSAQGGHNSTTARVERPDVLDGDEK